MNFKKTLFLAIFFFSGLFSAHLGLAGDFNNLPNPQPSPNATIPPSTIEDLGRLRAALDKFKSNKGTFPRSLDLLLPTYIRAIPSCMTLNAFRSGVQYYSTPVRVNGQLAPAKILGSRQWGYVNNPSSPDFGFVFIDYKSDAEPSISTQERRENESNLKALCNALALYYVIQDGDLPHNPNGGKVTSKQVVAAISSELKNGAFPAVETATFGTNAQLVVYDVEPTSKSVVKNVGGWGYVSSNGTLFFSSTEQDMWKSHANLLENNSCRILQWP